MKFYPQNQKDIDICYLTDLDNWEAGIIVEGADDFNGNLIIKIGEYGIMPERQDYFDYLEDIKVTKVSGEKYIMEF